MVTRGKYSLTSLEETIHSQVNTFCLIPHKLQVQIFITELLVHYCLVIITLDFKDKFPFVLYNWYDCTLIVILQICSTLRLCLMLMVTSALEV